MIWGVLQRLTIIEESTQRLVLREWPLLEWLVSGALFLGAINMAIFDLWITAFGALVIGVVFVGVARVRNIVFDANADAMAVIFQYPLARRTMLQCPLEAIQRAHLRPDDSGATQIILVTDEGEMGLSVYSRDMSDWKEQVVIAINAFLHDVRQQEAREADIPQ